MEADRIASLTARHRECLRLVWRHKTSKDMARLLDLSPSTIDDHIEEACRRLGVRGRKQAAEILHEAEAALPQSFGGEPFGIPEAVLFPPLAARSDDRRPAEFELRETAAVYDAGLAFGPRPVGPPWRTGERPRNELSGLHRIAWALAIAFVAVAVVGAMISVQRGLF